MNGKKSKALRRLALAKTVGKPAVQHVTVLKTEKES